MSGASMLKSGHHQPMRLAGVLDLGLGSVACLKGIARVQVVCLIYNPFVLAIRPIILGSHD